MKKLLLVSTAIAGVAVMASPASAALKMDLGGYFDAYGVYADNHDAGGVNSLQKYAFRRNSDVYVNGETTLDNGLTVGAHTELAVGNNNADGAANMGNNGVSVNEVYAYGSGGWGRVNFGTEDGAAYLLQVAAPSADSNIDGLRTQIQALNPSANTQSAFLQTVLGTAGTSAGGNNPLGNSGTDAFSAVRTGNMDYQMADFRQTDRLTYLTPKFNGFQGGISYAPQPGMVSSTGGMNLNNVASAGGDFNVPGTASYKNLWEAAARWDGEYQGFAGSIGGGYSDSSLAGSALTAAQLVATNALDATLTKGIKSWNGGASVSNSGFSLGGAYKRTSTAAMGYTLVGGDATDIGSGDIVSNTYVGGLGYDNGPYHVGASYMHDRTKQDAISGADHYLVGENYTDTRYTLGGGYTFAPGMTFRGSVAWGKFDDSSIAGVGALQGPAATNGSNRYDQVAIGADIQF